MRIKIFSNYLAVLFLILVFPLCLNAKSSNLKSPNTTPMATLAPSKQYGIELPYTDNQCYITITNLKFDEPKKDFLRLRGTLRIDRDLTGKQIFIHNFNRNSYYNTPIYIENEPGKSLKAGEYRNFTTFTRIGEKAPKLEFLVNDAIQYIYQSEYTPHGEYIDFQGGPYEFVEADLKASNVEWHPELSVNTNYPFSIRADVLTPGPDDIILTKPLKMQVEIYTTIEGKEELVFKKDFPPLMGYLPQNRRMILCTFWDYKDMKGRPVPLDQFYTVVYVAPPFEYKLANSDKIVKTKGVHRNDSMRLPALTYYFSNK